MSTDEIVICSPIDSYVGVNYFTFGSLNSVIIENAKQWQQSEMLAHLLA
jgi:hypothetical protein